MDILTEFDYLWVRISFPLVFAITIANSIALAVFLKKSFLVKKSTYLLLSLTIADLLVGVSGIVHDAFILSQPPPSQSLTLIAVTSMFSTASILSLTFISLERLVAVFWPFHHRLAKSVHYFVAIAVAWVLTVCLPTPLLLMLHFPKVFHFEKNVVHSRWIILVPCLSLAIIVFSYLFIWIKLTFFTKFRNCRTIQENSKLTKTLFIVTSVSLATWLPKTTTDSLKFLNLYDNMFMYEDSGQYVAITFLLFSNSFLNLVVYAFRMPEFRRELSYMFCKCNGWFA